jgi:hypothetical protein
LREHKLGIQESSGNPALNAAKTQDHEKNYCSQRASLIQLRWNSYGSYRSWPRDGGETNWSLNKTGYDRRPNHAV